MRRVEVRVERDVHDRCEPVVVVGRVLLHVEVVDVRDELTAPLGLAAGEVEVGRVVVEIGRVLDLLDVRLAGLPVGRVGHVGDVVRRARVDRERAGADRRRVWPRVRLRSRVTGGEDVLRDDHDLVGKAVEIRLSRGLEGQGHRVVVRSHDAGQARAGPQRVQVGRGRGLHEIERERDVLRGERLTVAPLDAVAGRERDRRLVGIPRVGRRQHRRLLGVLERVDVDERLVHVAVGFGVDRRVERVELTGPGLALLVGDRERAALLVRRRGDTAGRRRS